MVSFSQALTKAKYVVAQLLRSGYLGKKHSLGRKVRGARSSGTPWTWLWQKGVTAGAANLPKASTDQSLTIRQRAPPQRGNAVQIRSKLRTALLSRHPRRVSGVHPNYAADSGKRDAKPLFSCCRQSRQSQVRLHKPFLWGPGEWVPRC